jgi:alkylation response protein AidB-like acyl-CoA dehydrogenase
VTALAEEHRLLREALGDLLSASMPLALVERCYVESGLTRTPWKDLADGGWLALLDEAELGVLDVVALAEEVGARLVAGPFATTVALTVPLLRALGESERLAPILDGSSLVAASLPAPVWRDGLRWEPQLSCQLDATGGGRVGGRVQNVAYLEQADELLAFVGCSDGRTRAVMLELDRPGVTTFPGALIDATRPVGRLEIRGLTVSDGEWLGPPDSDIGDLLARFMPRQLAVLDGEAAGGMRELLRRTVQYVSERKQFGVPVGSFQAVKHLIADAEVRHEVARIFVRQTAIAIEEDSASDVDHLASRLFAMEAYPRVAETAIQCFGGFGYTWEYELHLWYRRALVEQTQPVPVRDLRRLIGRAIPSANA